MHAQIIACAMMSHISSNGPACGLVASLLGFLGGFLETASVRGLRQACLSRIDGLWSRRCVVRPASQRTDSIVTSTT